MAEEELNKEHDPESNEASTSALRVESSATKARTSSSRGRQKRRITCSHCKRTGHMESDCYFLLENQGLMKRPECSNCKRIGHLAKDCYRKKEEHRSEAKSARAHNTSSSRPSSSSSWSERRSRSPRRPSSRRESRHPPEPTDDRIEEERHALALTGTSQQQTISAIDRGMATQEQPIICQTNYICLSTSRRSNLVPGL